MLKNCYIKQKKMRNHSWWKSSLQFLENLLSVCFALNNFSLWLLWKCRKTLKLKALICNIELYTDCTFSLFCPWLLLLMFWWILQSLWTAACTLLSSPYGYCGYWGSTATYQNWATTGTWAWSVARKSNLVPSIYPGYPENRSISF